VGLQPLGSDPVTSGDRSAEDSSLSDYSLTFKYQTSEGLKANLRSLNRPVEDYRLALDLTLLRRHLKGPRILDFPIGTGRLYPHLIRDYEFHGFDISPQYVQRAQTAYPDLAERFQVNSFETVTTPMKFDSVYSMRVMNNLKDRTVATRNVAQLLKPGGRWLFNMPQSRFHDSDFRCALENNGFKVIVLRKYDAYAVYGSMPRLVDYLYGSLFLRAVRKKLMPQWGYRLIDRVLSGYGSYFVVVERQ
jgi:SAM-dependent methyltransferase